MTKKEKVEIEGVSKFQLAHEFEMLVDQDIETIEKWRHILRRLELIGADPSRYGGYGFGNLSHRTANGFLITGSQTGEHERLSLHEYAEVLSADIDGNKVVSIGEVKPSSESMTHAAIYAANPNVRAVFHVHSPDIWQKPLPATGADIPYGTPQMAKAVQNLIKSDTGVFVMAGHTDGVVSYGTDCHQAGLLLVEALAN